MIQQTELKRMGAQFRGLLNDLKRRPEDAAKELGIELHEIHQILNGERAFSEKLIEKAINVWPLNPRDFYLLRDDAPSGVKIMRQHSSEASRRVMSRAGKEYYEYRDTAMTSVASFRPEWIQELCIVEDNDPNNSQVQWNNGHFLHQFTYFVGPVNFYYKGADGRKYVAVMNTGDSMYISPFVPHTFASRKNEAGQLGHILALTYGNKLGGENQQELSLLGKDLSQKFTLDFSTREKCFSSILKFYRSSLSMSTFQLAKVSSISVSQIEAFEKAEFVPDIDTISLLATALNIDTKELMPPEKIQDAVIVEKYENSRNWKLTENQTDRYKVTELASTKNLPSSKAVEIICLESEKLNFDLQVNLHQYIYNIGPDPVSLHWEHEGHQYSETLAADDSLYMKPCISHCYRGQNGRILSLRIGGRIGGETMRELSLIGKQHLPRIIEESMQWYNPQGRQTV